ncbi:MAG TPA: PD-(D/E)XK nuclease family protein [Candidatus Acidoferrales bacterium]|nr:PD-(D/E)XK nuclease family protein [Candidatus Acidoferrales bacterium]
MLLLIGPAGSGKTDYILEGVRQALRSGNSAIRLLVPTATLAQHWQNRLAREGFVFRRGLIQTLSGFVQDWAGEAPQVPDSVLYLIVEQAALRVNRPEFARVVQMPGFCASLARTMAEFSSAGCDSGRLATCLPDAPLAAAFLAVYQDVDRELARRGLAMRATRLQRAAARIEREGLGGIGAIWLDGFHALPDPELAVIAALGRHASLTLALSDADLTGPVRGRLQALGFQPQPMTRKRPMPATRLVVAPNIEREVDEIARRILEQAAVRPFREMAIVVRSEETYVPILRATLERFGIPARFYFKAELQQHAAVRCLGGIVDAMLGGWDHAATLAALRLLPRFAESNTMDRFAFKVRERIPNAGLGAMKALLVNEEGQPHGAEAEQLLHLLDSLAALEEWRSLSLLPKAWAARFGTLRNYFRPARPRDMDHTGMNARAAGAAVLDVFDECLAEAAQALDPAHTIPMEAFWRAVTSVLRLKPLRLADGRRNVVHVLSAEEARQWVLPVVFVCGMVEKQFPRFHPQNPYFPDAARARLNAAGVRVRTAPDFEREERALWDSAVTRATMLVTLSYPEFDARGDATLRSLFLDSLILMRENSEAVRPAPRYPPAPRGLLAIHTAIRNPSLLDYLRQKSASLSPSKLETYLQCPFQYFSLRMIRLKTAPPRPGKRLDFMTQGNIVHQVLAEWWANPQDITALFDRVFAQQLEEKRIPGGYHTERLRNAMLEDLQTFTRDDVWPRAAFHSRMEEKFEMPLDDSVVISGKIDRLDVDPDGNAYVIDYKYSARQRVLDKPKDETLLQAPLYLMAAEKFFGLEPAGMFYIGVKGGINYAGWSVKPLLDAAPLPQDWFQRTRERTLKIVQQIRSGRVEPAPANVDNCRFCDARDVCRIETRGAEVVAEIGAEIGAEIVVEGA